MGARFFHINQYPKPSMELLPGKHINQNLLFKIIGTYYTGSLLCKIKGGKETKVYILSFTRSLTRAIHLELLPSQSTQEFIMPLKRLISKRSRASIIYSDNGKIFFATSKLVGKTNKDEEMSECFIKEQIKRKFNLSSASWRSR